MSVSEDISIECPQCKEKQEVTVWKHLDIVSDPEAKEALFAWKINVFNCSKCGIQALLPVGLLYDDPGRQYCISYYPVDFLGNEDFYTGFSKAGEPVIETSDETLPEYRLKPHVVFDLGEMMRYIVFREVAFEKGM